MIVLNNSMEKRISHVVLQARLMLGIEDSKHLTLTFTMTECCLSVYVSSTKLYYSIILVFCIWL